MEVIEFLPEMTDDVAGLLARAFAGNPLHLAAFGANSVVEKNRAFFRNGLSLFRGRRMAAVEGTKVIGFAHWVKSPGCQFSLGERLGLLPVMLYELGPASAMRVSSWLSEWARRDAKEAHWHLGPIGVDPGFQGKGIGRQLLQIYCSEMDDAGDPGYLETDKLPNVEVYRRFGFEVESEGEVIGVRTYFMTRPARRRGL
jgi:GNAT superfamily N-acetyltransferase